MNAERLSEIEARCEKATPGPWVVGEGTPETYCEGWNVVCSTARVVASRSTYRYHEPDEFDDQTKCDIEFIAHARSDVPDLLTEVKRLQAEMESYRKADTALNEALNMGDGSYKP